MSCILHIETSTSACSVAVSEDGQNVFKKEDLKGGNGEWNYGNAQKNVTIKMKQAVENKE